MKKQDLHLPPSFQVFPGAEQQDLPDPQRGGRELRSYADSGECEGHGSGSSRRPAVPAPPAGGLRLRHPAGVGAAVLQLRDDGRLAFPPFITAGSKRGGLSFESCTTGFLESPGLFEPPEVSLVLPFFWFCVSLCFFGSQWLCSFTTCWPEQQLRVRRSVLLQTNTPLKWIAHRWLIKVRLWIGSGCSILTPRPCLNATDGRSKPWMMCSKGLLWSGSQWCGDFQRTKSVLYESVKQRELSCR